MKTLDPKSSAATLLLRNHTGDGYCAGPEFPGATIRHGIDKLFALGYLAGGGMTITAAGHEYLGRNHLSIKS